MRFIFSVFKTIATALLVLLISQIPVKGKRVCDHVALFTKSEMVQKPIRFLAKNLDFTQAHKVKKTGANHNNVQSGIQKKGFFDNITEESSDSSDDDKDSDSNSTL